MMKYQNFEKKFWKIVQKTKSEIIPHFDSHCGTKNQMRMENYPQCATQCATQWDWQNHMKRAIVLIENEIPSHGSHPDVGW